MAYQFSTGLRKLLANGTPLRQAMAGARMVMYDTAQATDADTGVSSSGIIATLTNSGVAFTGETRANWADTITNNSGSTADYIRGMFIGSQLDAGTAQAGSAGSITLQAGASATDNFYVGCYVKLTGGTNQGAFGIITAYVGSTKVATVSTVRGTFTPSTDTYRVISGIEILGADVQWNSDMSVLAANLVTQINSYNSPMEFVATSSSGVLTITAGNGIGNKLNCFRLFVAKTAGSTHTIAVASGYPAASGGPSVAGVAAVGGMTWGEANATTAKCQLSATWSTGTGITYGAAGSSCKAGTLASFRILIDPADDGTSTSTTYPRIDGNIGTVSTNDLEVSSTTRKQGDPISITDFQIGFKATASA